MGVIKLIVENNQVRLDDLMSIDISGVALGFAAFINRFDVPESIRIKLKYCSLCDSICEHKNPLTLRRDSILRHSILDIVVEWFRPAAVRAGS